jgi:hypothetical protein
MSIVMVAGLNFLNIGYPVGEEVVDSAIWSCQSVVW